LLLRYAHQCSQRHCLSAGPFAAATSTSEFISIAGVRRHFRCEYAHACVAFVRTR
jgi:hypothetical protein